jgi:hypothetical protein
MYSTRHRPGRRGAGHLGGERAPGQGGGMRGGHAPVARCSRQLRTRHQGSVNFVGRNAPRPTALGCMASNTRGLLAANMRDAHDETTVGSTTQRGPTEHDLLKDRGDRAQRGFGGLRAAFGIRTGQLTIRSSRSSSLTSSSLALTRPRTEIPAWCTVSGSPETSGCHQ